MYICMHIYTYIHIYMYIYIHPFLYQGLLKMGANSPKHCWMKNKNEEPAITGVLLAVMVQIR